MNSPLPPSTSLDIESAVYETALSLDGEAREEFLRQFYHGNEEGLERMRRLLRQAGKSAAFFLEAHEHQGRLAEEILESIPEPAAEPVKTPASEEGPGAHIGPYRLIERIGEGGYGVVYEAEQEKPFVLNDETKVSGIGYMTPERWNLIQEQLLQIGGLKDEQDVSKAFTTEYLTKP